VWDGHQLRDLTYVDDAVDAFLLAAIKDEANGKVMDLGGNEVISLTQLADLVVAVNGSGDYIQCEFPSNRKRIDIGDYYANFDQARAILSWEPKVSLQVGLDETIGFYRRNLA